MRNRILRLLAMVVLLAGSTVFRYSLHGLYRPDSVAHCYEWLDALSLSSPLPLTKARTRTTRCCRILLPSARCGACVLHSTTRSGPTA